MTSHGEPRIVSIEFSNNDGHINDIITQRGHTALNVIDPIGELTVKSKGMSKGTYDVYNMRSRL